MHCVLYLALFVQLMLMLVLDSMKNHTFAAKYMLRYYNIDSRDEVGLDTRRSHKVSAPVELNPAGGSQPPLATIVRLANRRSTICTLAWRTLHVVHAPGHRMFSYTILRRHRASGKPLCIRLGHLCQPRPFVSQTPGPSRLMGFHPNLTRTLSSAR